MPELRNKTILILSPQAWGKMFLSKHHYAIELAKRGNRVYFLNPPVQQNDMLTKSILIEPIQAYSNLFLIQHRLFFPYILKFKWIGAFHFFMLFQIRRILKLIGPIDIVWSFDLVNLYPLSYFPRSVLKVFHPVDEPLNKEAIAAAEGADIMFSITREILDKYHHQNIPKHFIHHGVSDDFLQQPAPYVANHPVRIGFSGNLLRPDIDRKIFIQIISDNPDCIFECWGSYNLQQTNIGGGSDSDSINFIKRLENFKNVILHGAINSQQLAKELRLVEAFLICYDVEKDQSKGTNYHKVMEYLSTGKVIISNNITTYKNMPRLVQMIAERKDNNMLPNLFKKVVSQIEAYNSAELMLARSSFASENSYRRQLDRLEEFIHEMR